jgi:hypothetical protein
MARCGHEERASRPFREVRDKRRIPAGWAVDSTALLTEEPLECRPLSAMDASDTVHLANA